MNKRSAKRLAAVAAGTLALGTVSVMTLATGGSAHAASSAQVGVILPDTTSSPRWEGQDRPNLQKAFTGAGVSYDIENADGSVTNFGTICDNMISEGVKVLLVVDLDPASGAACEKKAEAAGVATIDYDRLTLGGDATYYVSFNNVKVGQLMGHGLIAALKAKHIKKPRIAEIDGASTDNNATLFAQGYNSVLNPLYKKHKAVKVGEGDGNWDATTAGTVYEQMYTKAKGKIDGIISANDTMAGGIIAREKAEGVKLPITGQDAGVEGLDNILAGYQSGTVYKNTSLEAHAASQLAIDLIKGKTAAAKKLVNGKTYDSTLKRQVPSVLETPVWVTAKTVKTVIAQGQEQYSQVCAGKYLKLCKKYGVKKP